MGPETMRILESEAGAPARCELQNRMFTALGNVRFQRSASDGVPMLAVPLGEREGQLPLHSLRREFAIVANSADDRMLNLIGSALEFVTCLTPGDHLPAEVRTGEASWSPDLCHGLIASGRLRLDLVRWLSPNARWSGMGRDVATLQRLADDPALWADVQAVAVAAARTLDLQDSNQVLLLLEDFTHELSFIEALRQRLLLPVATLCRQLATLHRTRKRGPVSFDTLLQVHRLSVAAYRQVSNRFDEVDAQVSDTANLLRNPDSQRAFIRSSRDWLYRNYREWTPLLERWEKATPDDLSRSLAAAYRFLAPRAMITQRWVTPQDRRRFGAAGRMTW